MNQFEEEIPGLESLVRSARATEEQYKKLGATLKTRKDEIAAPMSRHRRESASVDGTPLSIITSHKTTFDRDKFFGNLMRRGVPMETVRDAAEDCRKPSETVAVYLHGQGSGAKRA